MIGERIQQALKERARAAAGWRVDPALSRISTGFLHHPASYITPDDAREYLENCRCLPIVIEEEP